MNPATRSPANARIEFISEEAQIAIREFASGAKQTLRGRRVGQFSLGPIWVHWLPNIVVKRGGTRRTNLSGTTG